MIKRVYAAKKEAFDPETRMLKNELACFLGQNYPELNELKGLSKLRRYDVDGFDDEQFKRFCETVFSGLQCEGIFCGAEAPTGKNARTFAVEYLPGQYDQRSDFAEQCAELVLGHRPRIRAADFYIFEGAEKPLSDAAIEAVKKYLINPVDSREAAAEIPISLETDAGDPPDVPVLTGFIHLSGAELEKLAGKYGLGMSIEDILFCQNWFAGEGRDPTLTELKVLDTYWSDHCRHTTFNTALEEIKIAEQGEGFNDEPLKKALELYEETRREVYAAAEAGRKRSLMDMATIGAKALKQRGLIPDLDESPEINACSIKVNAEFADADSAGSAGTGGITTEPWLLLFKNETHNHPTEIEPFGGAATCLGGAIRDPLSGRAFVYQAMRITGGGDPRAGYADTVPGKLPQIKIAREAAAGYSSYGNQAGVAAGQVAEIYHPGFIAKRMELGALIGAVPEAWVRREEPEPGDAVILVGGKTGRDGIGGATSSSKVQSSESAETAGAEVQKGNAAEERKIVRLFRKAEVCRLIKRCNDFGAGGVSVAVGELAAGLDIDLDAVPAKYPGLDGTELAISESQERMAVVTSAADAEKFIKAAAAEDLEAVVIAKITAGNQVTAGYQITAGYPARLRMNWRGKTIVDISREFLNTNGATRSARVLLKAGQSCAAGDDFPQLSAGIVSQFSTRIVLDNLKQELSGLRSASRRGLQERFDSSAGAASLLFPLGGAEQGTPECGMAALLPSLDKKSLTASLMTFGYDPVIMSHDPYRGAKGSVREALAKFACLGGDPFKARLSFQEYFERTIDPETWGKPAAALLGALEAQLRLGVPAIGGKDSMSGNYRNGDINITVPPTLVAFAAGTAAAQKIRSGALSGKAGNAIILLSQSAKGSDEWEIFKTNMKTLEALAASGALKAAYPVGAGGVAAALAVMAFGNMCGVEAYTESFSLEQPLDYQGSVLAEIDETALPLGSPWVLAGRTLGLNEPVFRIAGAAADSAKAESAQIPLDELRRVYEYPLSQVYPLTASDGAASEPLPEPPAASESVKSKLTHKASLLPVQTAPLVLLPVFPGTNCEWDMERAFREAGAKTRILIFKNRSTVDIISSFRELEAAFREAQIIAFSGGFSPEIEPAGPGLFIAQVLRFQPIAAAVMEFLEKRDGLILGICDGFQALLQTGLLPYGRIISPGELPGKAKPAFANNTIGRHISRMVRTRVMPSNSPWLSLEEPGGIHVIPVSHSQGRIVVSREEAEALFAAGQVPFCYAEQDNPNGSAFAIEGLTSPDGRILGKMGHSERCGEFVHINIPGNKRQRIFEAGVRFFTNRG